MNMETIRHELKNGIRMIHAPLPSGIGYCGLLFNTGSRDEREDETGMAHFIEHILFKGTQKRKAWHILSRLEDVGGELNAYTTKEETFIYASFLKEDFPRAMELLADIAFHSTFPENEIRREKEVVLEEINSYLDSPGELIYDEFENMIFPGQPLGKFILGTPDDVKKITREKVLRFYQNNYATDEVIFCSAGDIPGEKIKSLFEKYFSDIPYKPRNHERTPVSGYNKNRRKEKKDTYQSHCIIGTTGYRITDKKRTGLYLLNNILGGQGLNSRLNITLREKRGLAYSVESSYNPYMDTGVFSVYFGTDRKDLDKSIRLTMNELKKLREKPLGPMQLKRAKKQLSGQLIRSTENPENLISNMGKTLLVFNKPFEIKTMLEAIENLTAGDVYSIANEILEPSAISSLIFY